MRGHEIYNDDACPAPAETKLKAKEHALHIEPCLMTYYMKATTANSQQSQQKSDDHILLVHTQEINHHQA